jgi:hypothetical protein
VSQQFLEQSVDSDRLLKNADQVESGSDFLAQRPLIEEENSERGAIRPAEPSRGLLGGSELEEPGGSQAQAAPGPRNWDSLTSRGFLGLKWLFNIGGARDKRKAEQQERRIAFKDAWERGGSKNFADTSGILSSRWGRSQLAEKKGLLKTLKAGMIFSPNLAPEYARDLKKYTQLNGIASAAAAAAQAKKGKKGKKGTTNIPEAAPEQVGSAPSSVFAEGMSEDAQWHQMMGSQPFGQATAGPGPSVLRRPPKKSGMKAAANLQSFPTQRTAPALEGVDEEVNAEVESTHAKEANAHEAFLQAQQADTTGRLANLDATLENSRSGRVRITAQNPRTEAESKSGSGADLESRSNESDNGDAPVPNDAKMMGPLIGYAKAMQDASAAERARQAFASVRQLHEQGGLAMPGAVHSNGRGASAAFFNGFWGQEQAEPAPTRRAGHNRRVNFDSGNANLEGMMNRPAENLDPNREGGQDRVLPTKVHRYLTAQGGEHAGEAEVSDADAFAQSMLQTKYNRHMASLDSSSDIDTMQDHASRFEHGIPVEHFAGTMQMFANRKSKTSTESRITPEQKELAFTTGSQFHRKAYHRK